MTTKPLATGITSLQRRQIALEALVDERTVKKVMRGLPVMPMCVERVRRVFESRGLLHLLPENGA